MKRSPSRRIVAVTTCLFECSASSTVTPRPHVGARRGHDLRRRGNRADRWAGPDQIHRRRSAGLSVREKIKVLANLRLGRARPAGDRQGDGCDNPEDNKGYNAHDDALDATAALNRRRKGHARLRDCDSRSDHILGLERAEASGLGRGRGRGHSTLIRIVVLLRHLSNPHCCARRWAGAAVPLTRLATPKPLNFQYRSSSTELCGRCRTLAGIASCRPREPTHTSVTVGTVGQALSSSGASVVFRIDDGRGPSSAARRRHPAARAGQGQPAVAGISSDDLRACAPRATSVETRPCASVNAVSGCTPPLVVTPLASRLSHPAPHTQFTESAEK